MFCICFSILSLLPQFANTGIRAQESFGRMHDSVWRMQTVNTDGSVDYDSEVIQKCFVWYKIS